MRRVVVPIVVLAVVATAGAARADEALERLLEDAAAAEFQGRGIVLCSWGGDSAASTYEVARRDGMSMVRGGGVEIMVGGGLAATRSGAGWYGLEIDAWSEWSLSDRYSLSEPVGVERLGRPARELLVLEGAQPRARVVIDAENGVPLLTEILTADGATFRVAALLDVDFGEPGVEQMTPAQMMERQAVPEAPAPGDLPATAAWYRRADVYAGPEGVVQAFYTDGLFSFSVFESERGDTPEAFEDAATFALGDDTYRRIVTPSQVWIQWHAPDWSYVLVGDLPPDHLEAVLEDLPGPGDRNVFVRLWRWLFG